MLDWEVKKSNISGKGLFAKKSYNIGDVVLCSFVKRKLHIIPKNNEFEKHFEITEVNKWVNHSANPNTIAIYNDKLNAWFKIASRRINTGDEITSNYKEVMTAIKVSGYDPFDWLLDFNA